MDHIAKALEVGADLATVVGLFLAIWAFTIARRDLQLSRKATSAAAFLTVSESFRSAWMEFRKANNPADRDFHFGELANLIERACALHNEGLLYGLTMELLRAYLDELIEMIEGDPETLARLDNLIVSDKTFEQIAIYRRGKRLRSTLTN